MAKHPHRHGQHREEGQEEAPVEETSSETSGEASPPTESAPVESVPENEDLGERIRLIEKRHGKEFMAVLADVHDHLFGKTPPEPKETQPEDTSGN
jgi:hypothetical protein